MDCRDAAVVDAGQAERFSADGDVFSGAPRAVSRFPARSSLQFGAFPSAVPCARLHARQLLWEWGLAAITDTAELLISELVTNGVKAAEAADQKPPVQLRLSGNRACLLIEIWDGNTQPPVPRGLENDIPALEAEGGRGLLLVETLSERWGWYPTRNPEGKVTWCELENANSAPA
jgi:anti-sigma regulatory factor (Ser/Thr protein kinase)